MLKKKHTLNSKEFEKVIKKGSNYGSRLFFIKVLKNDLGYIRIGIGVSKKLTKSPVKRNYYKRLLRHVLKETLSIDNLNTSYDIVIIMQPGVADKKFEELKKDVEILLRKTNILA